MRPLTFRSLLSWIKTFLSMASPPAFLSLSASCFSRCSPPRGEILIDINRKVCAMGVFRSQSPRALLVTFHRSLTQPVRPYRTFCNAALSNLFFVSTAAINAFCPYCFNRCKHNIHKTSPPALLSLFVTYLCRKP